MTTLLLLLQFIAPPTVHKTTGYTHAVKVSGCQVVFISGQVALDVQGNVVGKDDFAAQAEQVFRNLSEVLKAAGGGFQDVIKFTYFVVGLTPERLTAVRNARTKHVTQPTPPASTLIGVTALARPDFLLEVEAVACVK
jgi:enamine deaminase RidA (YjgF/YER057c/UK114 family)